MLLVLVPPKVRMIQRKNFRKKKPQVKGNARRLRLSVFRSRQKIYAQIIDDTAGRTIVAISEAELPEKVKKGTSKTERANLLGELLAKKALSKKIKKIVFDRGCYHYHGRVKALADGARKKGMEF